MSLEPTTKRPGKRPMIDGAGHVDPRLREGLRERAHTEKETLAFLGGHPHSDDPLAEFMGEAVIQAVTTGQDDELESLDAEVTEELGGLFIETTSEAEGAIHSRRSNASGSGPLVGKEAPDASLVGTEGLGADPPARNEKSLNPRE